VDVGKSLALAEVPGGLGIDVPRWAQVEVPGSRMFDIQAAIVVSSACIPAFWPVHDKLTCALLFLVQSHPEKFGWVYPHQSWSAVQIALPIVTAIVSALLVGLFVFLKEVSRRKRDSLAIGRARRGMVRLPSISSLNDVKRKDVDGA